MNIQERCELGQQQLMRTQYLEAEATLESAEREAWDARDFDTLARLYMPLQEARRQRRQRCGEGVVCLDIFADVGQTIIEQFPHGPLLVAGWGTIEPAVEVRRLARERGLYVETFLGATYRVGAGRVVVIAPSEDVRLPDDNVKSINELMPLLPAHCIVLGAGELPKGCRKGDTSTYAEVMAMWERLHAPFLAAADMQVDPIQKIEGYRKTQRVDYGCELAHQKAADVARELARQKRV